MKIVILTTETTHHNYIVRELQRTYPIAHVMLETTSLKAPFNVSHPYLIDQENYELKHFFAGKMPPISTLAECSSYASFNSPESVKCLASINPEVVIVAGSSRLKKEFLGASKASVVNLHGGDPEKYRGLDSHLWSIYHNDFESLKVTLHRVEEGLDTGDIVQQGAVPLKKGMKLHQLRAENVALCVKLLNAALDDFATNAAFKGRAQREVGRYYSFMPSDLKEFCRGRFESYTAALQQGAE